MLAHLLGFACGLGVAAYGVLMLVSFAGVNYAPERAHIGTLGTWLGVAMVFAGLYAICSAVAATLRLFSARRASPAGRSAPAQPAECR